MRVGEKLAAALRALLFLALGGCLLLAGAGMLRAEGVTVAGAPAGKLYLPSEAQTQTLPLHYEHDHGGHDHDRHDHGGHDHGETVSVGGRCGAALLLADRADGAEALAVELARRGVAVLIPGKNADAAEAWDWLLEQSFVRASSAALIAAKDRAPEALSLGKALVPTQRAAAAAILLGDDETLRLAADHPGRNLLILTDREPDGDAKRAFLGAGYDGRRDFTGYFSEGTARAVERTEGRGRLSSRPVLVRILDWQGSALGHAVELRDDDLIFRRIVFCRVGAALCLVSAGLAFLPRRKRGQTD